MSNKLEQLVQDRINSRTVEELALGWLRYETIRKLSPAKFKELHARNLKGEWFDGMIDELITTP